MIQIPEIVTKCKAAERGSNICDYAYNAYGCFLVEIKEKNAVLDGNDTMLIGIEQEHLYRLDFGLDAIDEELIEEVQKYDESYQ